MKNLILMTVLISMSIAGQAHAGQKVVIDMDALNAQSSHAASSGNYGLARKLRGVLAAIALGALAGCATVEPSAPREGSQLAEGGASGRTQNSADFINTLQVEEGPLK
jgi:hypothetical protein